MQRREWKRTSIKYKASWVTVSCIHNEKYENNLKSHVVRKKSIYTEKTKYYLCLQSIRKLWITGTMSKYLMWEIKCARFVRWIQYLLLSLNLLSCDCFSVFDMDVVPLHLLQQSRFHKELRMTNKTVSINMTEKNAGTVASLNRCNL